MQETHDTKPEVQVFICTRTKEKGDSCGPKGAAELRDRLKKWAKNEGLTPRVKITASLCLGFCESGITVCIHPMNQWFIKVDAQHDEELLKEKIRTLINSSSV